MAQQQGNSLETMMMAYADLSGSGRGSSFKGPPLKEVKVNKQPAPAFTTSSKARDWTSLEQALEDAFTIAPSPASTAPTTVELTTSANFSTFSHWQDQAPTTQPVYPPPQAARQQSVDDWGDFQDFQKVSVIAEPQVTIQPKSVMEDDDFADFVTASCPPPPQQQQPVRHQLVNPVIHQQLTNPSFPQLPSSYSHPNPLVSQQPLSVNQPTPLLSNTVGLRLASFQEESPVHNFRATTKVDPVISTSDSPSRFEPFFGGADDDTFQFEVSSSASATLPAVGPSFTPFSQPLDSFPAMPITSVNAMSVLPTPIAPSNDKYGALSDLLSLSELDTSTISLSSMTSTTNQIFEPSFPSAKTDANVIQSSTSTFPTNFSNSLMSNKPQIKASRTFEANFNLSNKPLYDDEGEDFGDFITVPNSQNTTTAKPPSMFATTFPGFAATSPTTMDIMSWHDDGPPPMPTDDDDDNNDEDFDELNSSTNSGIVIADDLVMSDGNFFQQKTLDTSQTINSLPPQNSSPPDSLSLNSFEDSQTHQSNTDSSSPQMESVPMPQQTKSSNQIRTFEPPCLDQLKSPYREWSQALTQIFEILSSGTDTFSNISEDSVLDEVLESNEGSNYLTNIIEIYRVFKRIQLSYSMAVWNDTVQSQCEETEKVWKGLLVNLKSKASTLIPNRAVFDFSNCVVVTNNATSETVCSLCLLSITGHSKDVSQVIIESVCNFDQKKYHSTCANFWVNCVDPSLPKLI